MQFSKTSAMKKKKTKTAGAKPALLTPSAPACDAVLDYPKEGEKLRRGHYAVRVGAPGATEVQVCVNEGAWLTARAGAGYWWVDWWLEKTGEFRLKARARKNGLSWTETSVRNCRVVEVNAQSN
ncbi:MAG: hypothetical protein HYT79_12510 [Elusimicrobia bacterium]|nr:hypothetical protein [Elusimicrobiota bacterium]